MATSSAIDSKLDSKLKFLKKHFGRTSKSEVLLKVIALVDVAAGHENDDGTLTIFQNNKKETTVILR